MDSKCFLPFSTEEMYWLCVTIFCSGGYGDSFYEKLSEASLLSNGASTSQLQDGPISDGGRASGIMCLRRGKNSNFSQK